jgi:hypothetical protein
MAQQLGAVVAGQDHHLMSRGRNSSAQLLITPTPLKRPADRPSLGTYLHYLLALI